MELDYEVFLDSNSGEYSDIYDLPQGTELTLEVYGDVGTVSVQARVNTIDGTPWTTVDVISLNGHDLTSTITKTGIFTIGVSGVNQVRVHNQTASSYGDVNVYGKLVR